MDKETCKKFIEFYHSLRKIRSITISLEEKTIEGRGKVPLIRLNLGKKIYGYVDDSGNIYTPRLVQVGIIHVPFFILEPMLAKDKIISSETYSKRK